MIKPHTGLYHLSIHDLIRIFLVTFMILLKEHPKPQQIVLVSISQYIALYVKQNLFLFIKQQSCFHNSNYTGRVFIAAVFFIIMLLCSGNIS